jgi:transcriptional regulator with XRE-family HTH domain
MGQQMQRLRLRMNLTQKEAAAKIGMHFNQWAKYERGEKTMPLRWVQAIEHAYDIAFDIEPPAPTTKAPTHPPEYYKGMLEAGRRLSAAGQQIVEEAMDGLTDSVTTPSADRLAAASGAVAVRQAKPVKTAPRTRHRTG